MCNFLQFRPYFAGCINIDWMVHILWVKSGLGVYAESTFLMKTIPVGLAYAKYKKTYASGSFVKSMLIYFFVSEYVLHHKNSSQG